MCPTVASAITGPFVAEQRIVGVDFVVHEGVIELLARPLFQIRVVEPTVK